MGQRFLLDKQIMTADQRREAFDDIEGETYNGKRKTERNQRDI